MKILFLTNGLTEPASRFRVMQFLPHFRRAGIECTNRSAYGAQYNRLANRSIGPAYKLACRLSRAAYTLFPDAYDLVFLQRTALPGSALPERIAALRHGRVVFDFDDSIFLGPDTLESPSRRRAFRHAVRASRHVIAGNQYLAEQAAAPEKTTVIPTVVDTDVYTPAPERRAGDRVVIGWIGTSTNFVFLPQVVPAILRILDENPRAVFRLVANARYAELDGHPRVEQIPWSAETEIPLLQSFDVGVMPLYDSEAARGKCGFKMIQYMAVGCPVLASDVGANPAILGGSGAGELVGGPEGWYPPLRALVESAELRRRMGESARRHVVRSYSTLGVLGVYLRLFEEVAGMAVDRTGVREALPAPSHP